MSKYQVDFIDGVEKKTVYIDGNDESEAGKKFKNMFPNISTDEILNVTKNGGNNNTSSSSSSNLNGVTAGVISSALALVGTLTIGFIFVPLAAIVAIFGSINALRSMDATGIGVNVLAWILIVVGFSLSPVLIGIFVGASN